MTPRMPSAISGIYVSPTFVVFILALIAKTVTTMLLNRFRLSRFVVNPPLVFVAVMAIYAVLLGTFVIPV